MADDDERAREERAARLRGKIDRMTGRADGDKSRDASGDATADAGESDSTGGAPDEGTVSGAGSHARTDARPASGDESESHKGESPRDFVHRKMREGGHGDEG